jgi:cysteinyl-tRNA synthetase
MSKSLGNLVGVAQALEGHTVDALRLYFLSSHYRSPLNYSDDGLDAMERAAARLRNALRPGADSSDNGRLDASPFEDRFADAMDSDLNTPQAMGALFDLAREINRARERREAVDAAQSRLRRLGAVLGLAFLDDGQGQDLPLAPLMALLRETGSQLNASGQHKLAGWVEAHAQDEDGATIVETLLAIRRELRQAREYQMADAIRAGLGEMGVTLEDTADGTVWRLRQSS